MANNYRTKEMALWLIDIFGDYINTLLIEYRFDSQYTQGGLIYL